MERSRFETVRETGPSVSVAGSTGAVLVIPLGSRPDGPFPMARAQQHMDISLDTLAQPLQVVLLEDASFGSEAPQGRREPHRHDYHELIWTRRGEGEHSIDGDAS